MDKKNDPGGKSSTNGQKNNPGAGSQFAMFILSSSNYTGIFVILAIQVPSCFVRRKTSTILKAESSQYNVFFGGVVAEKHPAPHF